MKRLRSQRDTIFTELQQRKGEAEPRPVVRQQSAAKTVAKNPFATKPIPLGLASKVSVGSARMADLDGAYAGHGTE